MKELDVPLDDLHLHLQPATCKGVRWQVLMGPRNYCTEMRCRKWSKGPLGHQKQTWGKRDTLHFAYVGPRLYYMCYFLIWAVT